MRRQAVDGRTGLLESSGPSPTGEIVDHQSEPREVLGFSGGVALVPDWLLMSRQRDAWGWGDRIGANG